MVTSRTKSRKVDARTDERRIRVKQLWGKSDTAIADLLLEEGFDVESETPQPQGKRLREEWLLKRRDAMRRNVWNDREWWRSEWRRKTKEPRTIEDDAVARESFVAALESDLTDIDELQSDNQTKATAKAILQGEKRQTRALIAKARGVDVAPEQESLDPNATAKRATLVVYDLSQCSDEVKQRYGVQPSS